MSLIRPTIAFLALFTLIFGGAYPMLATGFARSVFPQEAHGSLLIDKDGQPAGSALIGQNFSQPQYFWGRLSAVAYNGAASSGSNYGANNPALLEAARARMAALQPVEPVPVDLVAASGSGLDPHISPEAAAFQIARVAAARGMGSAQVQDYVARATQGRQLGVLGEPRVNVLKLNLMLDGKL